MSDKQDRRSQRTRHLLSAALVELIREKDYSIITVSDIIEEIPFFPSLGLFRHVGEEYELYKSLLWGSGIDLLIKHLQKSLSNRIEQGLQESGKEFNVPLPILASFIAGSFLTLLKWWLENKMIYSPEEMDEIFKRLTLAGIEKKETSKTE